MNSEKKRKKKNSQKSDSTKLNANMMGIIENILHPFDAWFYNNGNSRSVEGV